MHALDESDEGYRAYWDDKNQDENPYEEGSREYEDWNSGWMEADLEVFSRAPDDDNE